jgi:predicted outer membrane protein
MNKFIAPALLATFAMCGQILAQSAADTDTSRAGGRSPASATNDQSGRSADQSDRSADRSSAGLGGQSSRTQGGAQRSQLSQTGAQQGSQANALEKQIAVCLTLGNQEEIQLGQFAQDRAQHPQVKQFAQMMVEEHQQAVSQLQQAMPELGSMNLELSAQGGQAGATGAAGAGSRTQSSASAQGGATSSTVGATTGSQRASATGAASQGGQQEMVQFAREVKQECLNLTQQELGRKQGNEFDKAYIGQQLVAHTNMLAELRAAQRHASSELQPLIQQGAQMTEHHLAQARQIMQQLDAAGQGGAEQAQRPGSQPQR